MVDYVSYLRELADELGCRMVLAPDMPGMMYVEFGYVEGPSIFTSDRKTPQQAFAINLHELGHVAYDHTQGRPPKSKQKFYFDNGVLHSEAQAWEFALTHFASRGETIEDATHTHMSRDCLGSYLAGAKAAGGRGGQRLWNGNRHHVAFTYDEPDEYFWNIMNLLKGEVAVAA